MRDLLPTLIFLAGMGQLCVLTASALVPFRLNWRRDLSRLPRLHRQLFWVYSGYVVLAIVTFGFLSLLQAHELAQGSNLARGMCAYMGLFWGLRLLLQFVLDVRPHLTTWWLRLGYHTLTVLFASFTLIFSLAALWPTT